MAILQTDASGIALTDNNGKALLKTSGSIIQCAYGQTTTSTRINDNFNFQPTTLSASIPVTSSTSQIYIFVSTGVLYPDTGGTGRRAVYDIMVSGGGYSNTVLSGSAYGFAGAYGWIYARASEVTDFNNVSYSYSHVHNKSAGTTLTYTVCGKGNALFSIAGQNTSQDAAKSTIILMEVV